MPVQPVEIVLREEARAKRADHERQPNNRRVAKRVVQRRERERRPEHSCRQNAAEHRQLPPAELLLLLDGDARQLGAIKRTQQQQQQAVHKEQPNFRDWESHEEPGTKADGGSPVRERLQRHRVLRRRDGREHAAEVARESESEHQGLGVARAAGHLAKERSEHVEQQDGRGHVGDAHGRRETELHDHQHEGERVAAQPLAQRRRKTEL